MRASASIVILTHNRCEYTRWCLKGLQAMTFRPLEVIFVDNGSTDETIKMLNDFKISSSEMNITIIENHSNVGCSTARNQGAEAASGQFIAFMDNDVVTRKRNWLEILTASATETDVGAASPKLLFPFPPYAIQFAGAAVSPAGKVQFMGRGEDSEATEHNKQKQLQSTISACMVMRRNVFEESGGFDEEFNPVQFEDIDLCYRLRRSGMKILHVPEAELYHFENVTTQGSSDVRGTYQIIRNGIRFKERWHGMFEKEGGPPDKDIVWRDLEKCDLADIEALDFI